MNLNDLFEGTGLSPETLASYKEKAGAEATAANKAGDFKKGDKRFSGIVKATKKQFANDEKGIKEGVDNLNDDDWYEIAADAKSIVGTINQRPPGAVMGRPVKLPNGNYAIKGMQAKHMGLTRGVAEGSLTEFAPNGFDGGNDGEEFNPRMAKMAYDEGNVKGVSLADGATLARAMAITEWDKQDGGIYTQHFTKGFKAGRMDKINHDNKQYNLNLKLMKDGSIRRGEQGVAEGSEQAWEVSFSDGEDVIKVHASSKQEAISKATQIAKSQGNPYPSVDWARPKEQGMAEAGPRAVDDQGNPIEKSKNYSVAAPITPDQLKPGGSYSTSKGVVTKTDTGLIHKARSSFTPTPRGVEEAANDYFKRRRDEEDRIAGTKAPAKRTPKQTDYEKKRKQQDVAEGEVVPLGKKHSGDLGDIHLCPKCGGDLQGGNYQGHRVKVCQPCKQVYLPPNSGIDQQGNKTNEQGVAEASYINGKEESPTSLRWKQTSMSQAEAIAKYGKEHVRLNGKDRRGVDVVEIHTPLGGVNEGQSDLDAIKRFLAK